MSRYGIIFLTFFLINTTWVVAASKSEYPLTIKVLSAHTESIPIDTDANDVPKDCNVMDYSAYCHYSRTAIVRHTMLVEDRDGKSFTITCAVDSRWSKCALLPVGRTFEAREEKRGITVLYQDSKGKERKQLYQSVAAAPAPQSGAAANPQPPAAAPQPSSTLPQPASPAGSAEEVLPEKVRCNFSSTPSGAEITVDARYVGNTPSEIGLTTGTHVVLLSLPGFAQWKRELTVVAGSVVNVTASLQKMQP
jgi:hypothetical protein